MTCPLMVCQSSAQTINCWIDKKNSVTLQWRHNGRDSISNHQHHDCLLNRLFRRRSKKTSKFRVTGLSVGKSSGTGEFPAQMARNAENVSICWRHHELAHHFCRVDCIWACGKTHGVAFVIPRSKIGVYLSSLSVSVERHFIKNQHILCANIGVSC